MPVTKSSRQNPKSEIRSCQTTDTDLRAVVFTSEAAFQGRVVEFLEVQSSIAFRQEVPILGRIVDLALSVGDCLITVEFKMSNWRRAIDQARDHRLVADHAYICMPGIVMTPQIREELNAAGVGLLAFDPDAPDFPFDEIVEAPQSDEIIAGAREEFTNRIQGGQLNAAKINQE